MKIHLLGPSGSGTSTLGKLIAGKYAVPWFDSDDIFWVKTYQPFTVKRDTHERILLLVKTLSEHDSWLLIGSALGWGDFPGNVLILPFTNTSNPDSGWKDFWKGKGNAAETEYCPAAICMKAAVSSLTGQCGIKQEVWI